MVLLTRQISVVIENGVATLSVDAPESKVNLLSVAFCQELAKTIESLNTAKDVKALVIVSGKDDFIVGADIRALEALATQDDAQRLSQDAQRLMNQIEAYPKPIVAAIHGSCLGGGLELALACHVRISSDDKRTQLGLPEVNLGILPAAGGTQRLPLVVGLPIALDMLLSGRSLSASKAKKAGLVDRVVPQFLLVEAARALALRRVGESSGWLHHTKIRLQNLVLLPVAIPKARKTVMAKTQGNFPAPLAILEVVQSGILFGMAKGLAEEARHFAKLSMGQVSRNLMRLFFLSTARKKAPSPRLFDTSPMLGVLGAGFMGSSIALVSLKKGARVYIYDNNKDALSRAQNALIVSLNALQKKGKMDTFEAKRVTSRVSFEHTLENFKHCDIVIEAVFEDLNIKKTLLKQLENVLKPNAVFASNTSALPIAKIAEGAAHPAQIVGMHYFSPVDKMPLLELVRTKDTSERTLRIAKELGALQGKTMITVNDAPGFYTSRILAPYLDEAVRLVAAGIDPHQIDKALRKAGFPVGPIQLLDEVGFDIALHVEIDLATYSPRFKNTFLGSVADKLLQAKCFGRKTGKGFYIYDNKKSKSDGREVYQPTIDLLKQHGQKETAISGADIAKRCLLRMINEAVLCLEEGVLENTEDGDVGAIFGLGFPAHLGGPFRYVDQTGANNVFEQLQGLAQQLGERFAPAAMLKERAATGARFT